MGRLACARRGVNLVIDLEGKTMERKRYGEDVKVTLSPFDLCIPFCNVGLAAHSLPFFLIPWISIYSQLGSELYIS